jgi:hypothetical protein
MFWDFSKLCMSSFLTKLHVEGYQDLRGTLYKQSIFVFLAQHFLVFQTYFQVSVGLVSQMGDSDRTQTMA